MSESNYSSSLRDSQTGQFASRHTSKHDLFSTWTPDMAWCLGYICADGSVRSSPQISFSCLERDRELLDSVKQIMETTHPIRHAINPGSWGQNPMVRLNVNSRQMASDLANLHGILPRKTWSDPSIPNIPDGVLGHFFRGYFDGDGCFHLRPIKTFQAIVYLVGTERFLNEIADRMHAVFGLTRTPVFKHKSIYGVQWTGKQAMRTIHDAMYSGNVKHFCRRKKAAFDAALASMPATHCRADSKTGFRGVVKNYNKFAAWSRCGKQSRYLGVYPTAVEAAFAYNLFAEMQNARPAELNPIPESLPQVVRDQIAANVKRIIDQDPKPKAESLL